ncbi:sensor domain-containing protein [Paractinoplanes lichenicola]|uniref:Sensor domain-containing protein n=1 Tax=Paractinoplanes lichenicola TaxID=2802976 RepID=A0ABS1VHJ4_9ACTN|nr:sensor domain-containing protein [Actinoplanes lichenicola]MBL7254183.1 sensor domain-containing protein [Actinoplanes lichenicola]
MTTTQLEMPLAVRLWPRVAADTRYVLTGLPLAVASFTVCLTLLTAGLTLAVVWIGIPLLVLTMTQARAFAAGERSRLAALGDHLPTPSYGGSRRVLAMLTDPQSWQDVMHATLRWIPSTISTSLVLTWWAGVLGGATYALWGWALPDGPDDTDLPQLLGLGDSYLTATGFYLIVALVAAATLPLVTHFAARLEAGFARALL